MLVTKEVEYEDGGTVCKGFIAYHSSVSKPLPCVMVAHDWGGVERELVTKRFSLLTWGILDLL